MSFPAPASALHGGQHAGEPGRCRREMIGALLQVLRYGADDVRGRGISGGRARCVSEGIGVIGMELKQPQGRD